MSDTSSTPESAPESSSQSTATTPETPAATAPAAAPSGPQMSAKEVEDGKMFAILCYAIFFFPFWLVPLIMRNNNFSLYHAKQCLIMWLVGMATIAVAWVPCLGLVVWAVVFLGLLVLSVMGLINAMNGMCKPVPVVGKLAEQWFGGLTKTAN